MTIETKVEEKEYIKLMYTMTYRNPVIIGSTLIIIMIWVSVIFEQSRFNMEYDLSFYLPFIVIFLFLVVRPIAIYFRAKRNYAANSRLHETLTYEFTEDKILVKGESFTTERTWDKTYQVVELNNWILLYDSRTVFNLIPKTSFGDKLEEFKNMVRSKPGIKLKLK